MQGVDTTLQVGKGPISIRNCLKASVMKEC
jgi:hypothetical protein